MVVLTPVNIGLLIGAPALGLLMIAGMMRMPHAFADTDYTLAASAAVAVHFPYAAGVVALVPESSPAYLPLMAPAGIVAHIVMPLILVRAAYIVLVRERGEEDHVPA